MRITIILIIAMACFGQLFDRNGYGNDSGTEFLGHFDGADNGTVFTDASKNGFTVTRSGVVTKTAIKQFGTASGYKNGGHNIKLPDNAVWDITSKNFTIDCWVYMTDTTQFNYFGGAGTSTDHYILTYDRDNNNFYFRIYKSSSLEFILTSTTSPTENTWYHIAITKRSDVYSIYISGKFENSVTDNVTLDVSSGLYVFDLPYAVTNRTFYIDEFRYSSFCRWTKNFTPPNRAY